MARDFPGLIDPWQMAKGRKGFKGDWPLKRFARFRELIAGDQGSAAIEVQFGIDSLNVPFMDVQVAARPTLICQRSLEPFEFDLQRTVRLGLIRSDDDIAALPPDYEPLVVPEEPVRLLDLVEDELILGVPLVPKSDGQPVDASFGPADDDEEQTGPFAVLARLKDEQN